MTIQEVYEKYKHFDELISDKEWLLREDGEPSIINNLIYELWQAIKWQAIKEKIEESKK